MYPIAFIYLEQNISSRCTRMNVCKSHGYCFIETSEKNKDTLKYSHREKSMKAPFVIYADTESLLEKIDTCLNNPEKSSTIKVKKHAACFCSLFTQCSFDRNRNKHDYYGGKDCMKNFYKDLREHV